MKCKYSEDELVLYYYDELDASVKDKLKSHLAVCSKCANALERLKTTLNLIDLQEPELSHAQWDNYRTRVHEKIGSRANKGESLFVKPRIVQTAAALVLFLAVIMGGIKYYDVKQSGEFIMENYELMMDLELIEEIEMLEYLEEIEEV